jgi:tyrosyl-tRNA synthetase
MVLSRLARLVTDFWSAGEAEEAAAEFARTVQHKETPEEIPALEVPAGSDAALSAELVRAGLAKSRTEARRLMQQNAVEIDGKAVTEDIGISKVAGGSIIKVGKRRFIRIVKK